LRTRKTMLLERMFDMLSKILISKSLVAVALLGCIPAWGRSVALDLRKPTSQRRAVRLMAAASPQDDGTLRKVDLDAGSADVGDIDIGDELELTLFDDVKITLRLTDRSPSLLEGDVFLAEASGYDGVKNAVVLRTEEGLTVDIQDFLKDRVYKVLSTETGVTVQEIEPVKGATSYDIAVSPEEESESGEVLPAKKSSIVSDVAALGASSGGTTYLDVLVAYDKNAASWANSNGGGINNFAQTAVAKMNTAIGNTGLQSYFQFRLVGVTTVNATSTDTLEALHAVHDQSSGWQTIASKRDEVCADIVSVLIDTGSAYGTVGYGYSLGSDSSVTWFESYAYNVSAIRSVNQSHTMTHEIGHNLGAGHSDMQKSSPGPQRYSYSAGYYFKGNDGVSYHTIMSYDSDGYGGSYTEAPLFSSPDHYYKGAKVGNATHDNTRTIRNTYSYAAQWRVRKPDLRPYTPKGWSSPLVVSKSYSTATSSTDSRFLDSDNLYLSWAVECINEDIGSSFNLALYVDGTVRQTWSTSSLSAGYYWHRDGYNLGSLSVGTHTIKFVVDDGKTVDEINESNNTYTRTITVTRAPGSCKDAAVPFKMSSSIATYNVSLVKEWLTSYYSSSSGAFFAQAPVAYGGVYTIAMPKGSDFTVSCSDSSAKIYDGMDDNLQYWLIDARNMNSSSALATLEVHGAVGARVTVYAVAADYMPLGSWNKPETLPASSASGQFRYDVTRSLRDGTYSFLLNAVVGMRYEMRVSGRSGLVIEGYGGVAQLDSASGDGSCRILFECTKSGYVWLDVYANETGQVSVSWIGVDGSKKFKLSLDANGGKVSTAAVRAAYGDAVGELPQPVWAGHVFDGWHTAREGGVRVTAETRMTVMSDITLYARWTALAAGSCEATAVGFPMTDSVKTYNVNLVREWRDDEESYVDSGFLCCATTVERGRLYTIAMPVGSDFTVKCDDIGAVVTYGEDDSLAYFLIDARGMFSDSAKVHLWIYGNVGERVTVHAVAADCMPTGTANKPEVLPGGSAGRDFSYKVTRSLRNCEYAFSLSPEPDMVYEIRVSGQQWLWISFDSGSEGNVDVIGQSDGGDDTPAYVSFTCPERTQVLLYVHAPDSGPVTVEWTGRKDQSTIRMMLDGNSGQSPVDWVPVRYGQQVGDLPDAEREGYLFDGWYTAPVGGKPIASNTIVTSQGEFTVYAHWRSLAAGSCSGAPLRFAMTPSVKVYNVTLVNEWRDWSSSYTGNGTLCCATTVRRGGQYTIALPQDGPFFNVECDGVGAEVLYGEDDALSYMLIDTRRMADDTATVELRITGSVGEAAVVYVVAADCTPLGSSCRPEVLPASTTNVDGYFRYRVPRNLRNGTYEFTVNAVPGAVYLLSINGKAGADINYWCAEGVEVQILDTTRYWSYAALEFTCSKGGEVHLAVTADASGQVTVGWEGVMDCEDCYDVAPQVKP